MRTRKVPVRVIKGKLATSENILDLSSPRYKQFGSVGVRYARVDLSDQSNIKIDLLPDEELPQLKIKKISFWGNIKHHIIKKVRRAK